MLDWFLDARDCEEVNSFIWNRRNHGGAAAKHQQHWNRKLPLRLSLRCLGGFPFIAPLGCDSPRLASGGFREGAWRSQIDMVAGVRFFDNRRPNSANEVQAHGGVWDSEVQSSGYQIAQMKYTHAVNSFTVSCTWVLFLSSCSLWFVLPRQTVFLSSTLFFFLITIFLISLNYPKKAEIASICSFNGKYRIDNSWKLENRIDKIES